MTWKAETRTCSHCGNSYTPKAANQRWCSEPCKKAGNNAKEKFRAAHPDYYKAYCRRLRIERRKSKAAPEKEHGHLCKCRICKKKYHGFFDMCPNCQANKRIHHNTTGDNLYFV